MTDWKESEKAKILYRKVIINGQNIRLHLGVWQYIERCVRPRKTIPTYYCKIPEGKGGAIIEGHFF